MFRWNMWHKAIRTYDVFDIISEKKEKIFKNLHLLFLVNLPTVFSGTVFPVNRQSPVALCPRKVITTQHKNATTHTTYNSHIMAILHFSYLPYSSYDLYTFWMLSASSTIYCNLLSRCESATRLIIQRRFSLLSRSRGFYTYFPSIVSKISLRYNEHSTT